MSDFGEGKPRVPGNSCPISMVSNFSAIELPSTSPSKVVMNQETAALPESFEFGAEYPTVNELFGQIEEVADDPILPVEEAMSLSIEHEQCMSTEQEINKPCENFGLLSGNLDIPSFSLNNRGRTAVNRSLPTTSRSSPALAAGKSDALFSASGAMPQAQQRKKLLALQPDGELIRWNDAFSRNPSQNQRKSRKSARESQDLSVPPVGKDGIRRCVVCSDGSVRPQISGGNKHRWRCVNKSCRKWYRQVLDGDVLPEDLGARGRWRNAPFVIKTGSRRIQRSVVNGGVQGGEQYLQEVDDSMEESDRYSQHSRDSSESTEGKNLMSSLDRQTAWFGSEAYRNLPSPSCKIRNTPKDLLDISAVFKESGETLQAVDAIIAKDPESVDGAIDVLLDTFISATGVVMSSLHLSELDPGEATSSRFWSLIVHAPQLREHDD